MAVEEQKTGTTIFIILLLIFIAGSFYENSELNKRIETQAQSISSLEALNAKCSEEIAQANKNIDAANEQLTRPHFYGVIYLTKPVDNVQNDCLDIYNF